MNNLWLGADLCHGIEGDDDYVELPGEDYLPQGYPLWVATRPRNSRSDDDLDVYPVVGWARTPAGACEGAMCPVVMRSYEDRPALFARERGEFAGYGNTREEAIAEIDRQADVLDDLHVTAQIERMRRERAAGGEAS